MGVSGEPLLASDRSAAGASTVVVLVLVSFAALVSVKSVVEMVAVLVIEVFWVVDGGTVTTTVKLEDAPEASRLESAAV